MTAWQRLKNLWKLSAVGLPPTTVEPKTFHISQDLGSAIFIPHEKRDPVKELTNHE